MPPFHGLVANTGFIFMKQGMHRSGGDIRHGWLVNNWAGFILGLLICFSAAAVMAGEKPMTQRGYLQSMVTVCGDSLPAPTTDTALINWAVRKGMNPAGGWNLDAALTKEVMACTMVQLLNLAPAKLDFDPVRILDAKGIFIKTTAGHVTPENFARVINNDPVLHAALGRDDDNNAPTPTRPGNGYGDKNHDHTGPPGLAKNPKR